MDSSRFLDSVRDPCAWRQPPSMALSTSLSSGQPFYTVESLEGASSLPLLKSGFTSPPVASEREAFLLDAAKRRNLPAAEDMREALLWRNVSDQRGYADRLSPVGARRKVDGLLPPHRLYADGLPAVDGRTRFDGLPPVDARTRLSLDESQALDARSRIRGLGVRPHDGLFPGFDDRAKALGPTGGLALGAPEQRSFSEMIRTRELDFGIRSGAASFRPSENYLHGRKDFADVRTPAMARDSFLTRRDFVSGPSASSLKSQSERSFPFRKQEPRLPVEAARKQNKSTSSLKTSPAKLKAKPPPETAPVKPKMRPPPERSVRTEETAPVKLKTKPPPDKSVTNEKTPPVKPLTKPPSERSEGWCALCKIDCCNVKTLNIHLAGKKHKAMLEVKPDKANETSTEGTSTPAPTTQANKKRASDTKPDASQSVKRPKTSTVAVANGALPAGTPDAGKSKADESKKEKAKASMATDGKLACEVCKIFTTGQKNLELHLKGKRHAARLKELANS